MSSESPAPPGGNEQSINPYAASRVPEAGLEPATPFGAIPQRHYQTRLTWEDRRRFLQTTGPLRLYAVIGLAMGGWTILSLVQSTIEIWRMGESEPSGVLMTIRAALSTARGLLTLYTYWVYWQFAGTLAAVAGGSSTSMERWSKLQLRLAWLLLVALVLGVASLAWDLFGSG